MEDIRKRIDELTAQLNEASRAYYAVGTAERASRSADAEFG